MTVSYTGDVANASSFGCFNKILLKWRGSVYKLIYKELLFYISLYMAVNLFYREVLVANSECKDTGDLEGKSCRQWKESREMFESLRTYCHEQLSSIPLTFVLGFYVSLIVSRWWTQYSLLPWPDSMAMYTVTFITGKEERQRLMRRNVIRYVLLSYCMTMRAVSFRVKKRFPDLQHLVDAGLMREDELQVLHDLDSRVSANKWFLPLVWATDICARALTEAKVRPQTIRVLIGELVKIRENLMGIINHDWVSVPLVYTQVVTLAVYSYFGIALIGAQWIKPESNEAYKDAYGLPLGSTGAKLDLFYPFFLTIQFAFFFGWLKVAETLINPFGEDDDDFELNRLIDRHIQVGYLIVEHDVTPELLQDKYWDECIPKEIPYTVGAEKYKKEEFVGSAEKTLSIKEADKEYGYIYHNNQRTYASRDVPTITRNGVMMSGLSDHENMEGEFGDYESVGTPMASTKMSWLRRKMGRLDSVRSNRSISSSSTYIYGTGPNLTKKSFNKSQQSLYDKINRKFSLFDNHKDGGRSRKSSRQRSVSDTAKPKVYELTLPGVSGVVGGGMENKAFEKEEFEGSSLNDMDDDFDLVGELILDKKLLETITENQNSPYSTQASHCTSRRMSAQSIFGESSVHRRGSLQKEPFNGPVLELFHENELEEEQMDRISRSRSTSTTTESLSGSHRSKESGVGSLGEGSTKSLAEEKGSNRSLDNVDLTTINKNSVGMKTETSTVSLKSLMDSSKSENDEGKEIEDIVEGSKNTLRVDYPDMGDIMAHIGPKSELPSPSPSLPKRKPVMSLAKIEETTKFNSSEPEPVQEQENKVQLGSVGSRVTQLGSKENKVSPLWFKDGKVTESVSEEDIGSPFELMDTVYV